MHARLNILALFLAACAILAIAWSAPARPAEPDESIILIAKRQLQDRLYGSTILIARPIGAGRHVGFIVNRPTEVTLGKLFPLESLVAWRLRQVVDQAEVGVHRLKVSRVGLAQVPVQRAEHRRWRRQRGFGALDQPRQVDCRHETGCRALRVAFHARELAREQHARIVA